MTVDVGMLAQVETVVGADDTAAALGSGDLAVLGTPRVVALVEESSVQAIAPALDDTQTSVGVTVNLSYVRPSVVGTHITAQATVTGVAEREVTFEVAAYEATEDDEPRLIAEGTVVRMIVDAERFLARANAPQ